MVAKVQFPFVAEIADPPDPESAFLAFSRLEHCVFLDSALRHPQLGRYSFVCAEPFLFRTWSQDGKPIDELQQIIDQFPAERRADLPPFQGGAAGMFSYALQHSLERVPAPKFDEFQLPALAIGFYDTVLAYDHVDRRAWLISQGYPETEPQARATRATARLERFRKLLSVDFDINPSDFNRAGARIDYPRRDTTRLTREQLAPQFPTPGFADLTSNFSRVDFLKTVQRAIDYIYAGDVFQVNFAQRLLFPAHDAPEALYLRLRQRNPATFGGFFDLGESQIISASPERFLRVVDRQVETRPIKGTRQRTARPEADLYAAEDLRQSEKDRAENLMIVDLMRNDLSRVCKPDSVQVTQLCHLEVYQFVQHLVSAVCGELDTGRKTLDVVRAAFPGGSITGAPKVRAMEIIAELEPTARGAYCGSLGYLGFDGTLDLSILIRTITSARGWWQLPVGGGIVAQSVAQQEYDETWHKATGLVRALLP